MKLGTEVRLGPGHIVLDGAPAPLPKKSTAAPTFRPMSIVAKRLDGSRCHLVRRQASAQGTLYTTNPIIFVAILPTFQTLSSNRHSALLSSPDFHAVIVLHGSHNLHHFTSYDTLRNPIKVSISHFSITGLTPPLLHTTTDLLPPLYPQIEIIGTMMIVWRVRGKIIRSVLCNIVCNNCAQCNAHTYEQT